MNVYRIDGATGKAALSPTAFSAPNGLLLFAGRENSLRHRIARRTDPQDSGLRRRSKRRQVANKRVFVDAGPATPDGMRADIDGNLWVWLGHGDPELDGVVVYAPRRRSDRPHRAARALRQPLLRRLEAQPAVHGREPVDLRAVCEHARRAGGISVVATRVLTYPPLEGEGRRE